MLSNVARFVINSLSARNSLSDSVAGRPPGFGSKRNGRRLIDVTGERHIVYPIHDDRDGVTGLQRRDLRFLEIGDDPEIIRHHRDQERARADILPDSRLAFANPTGSRSTHDCIVEFDPGELEGRNGSIDIGLKLRSLR